RHARGHGHQLPDAHGRRAPPARQHDSRAAPGRGAGRSVVTRRTAARPARARRGRRGGSGMSAAPAPFYRRVEAARNTPALQAAVGLPTGRMVAHRRAAMAACPAAEAVRDRARAIRAHTIAHLDRYLRQFEANVVARGGKVHWAAAAADAVRLVVELAGE